MTPTIRHETAADHEAVRHVNRLAFGRDDEAGIVDALRSGGYARVSLVAEVEGRVVGHVLFSDLPILTDGGTVAALSLAPDGGPARVPEARNRFIAGPEGAGDLPGGEPPHRRRPRPPALLPPFRLLGEIGRAALLAVRRACGVDGAGVGAGLAERRVGVGPLPAPVRVRAAGPPRIPARPGRVGADAHRPLAGRRPERARRRRGGVLRHRHVPVVGVVPVVECARRRAACRWPVRVRRNLDPTARGRLLHPARGVRRGLVRGPRRAAARDRQEARGGGGTLGGGSGLQGDGVRRPPRQHGEPRGARGARLRGVGTTRPLPQAAGRAA